MQTERQRTRTLIALLNSWLQNYPQTNEGWGSQDSCVDENIQREIRVPVSVLGIGVLTC